MAAVRLFYRLCSLKNYPLYQKQCLHNSHIHSCRLAIARYVVLVWEPHSLDFTQVWHLTCCTDGTVELTTGLLWAGWSSLGWTLLETVLEVNKLWKKSKTVRFFKISLYSYNCAYQHLICSSLGDPTSGHTHRPTTVWHRHMWTEA